MTRTELKTQLLTGCQMPLFDLRMSAHTEIERLERRLEWVASHSKDEATRDFARLALNAGNAAPPTAPPHSTETTST